MDNYYYEHLVNMLKDHIANELRQKGKSDIEPVDYVESVEKWYKQIFDFVEKNQPSDFVRSINVFQDSKQTIKKVEYVYSDDKNFTEYLSINVFEI